MIYCSLSQGVLNDMGGPTIAAFDSSGCVFAVACGQTQTVLLFDASTLDSVSAARRLCKLTIRRRSPTRR